MLIWIADDDDTIRWVLQKALQAEGYECQNFASADQVASMLKEGGRPDLLLTDIRMPGAMNGLDLLDHFRTALPQVPVIVMTAHGNVENAVNTFAQGAFEYLVKPFDLEVAVEWVRRALTKKSSSPKNKLTATSVANAPNHDTSPQPSQTLQSASPRMQTIFRTIGKVAQIRSHVLITGESGTGKELVAKALHAHGQHGNTAPWVEINCAAVPRDLLESEMFGHERGAFTGATQQHIGHFERAHGGTLFLDEIGDMPLDLQARLLRVLATGQFYRVGGKQLIRVSTRIIAATHQHLAQLVQEKKFRQDLYYRLKVIHIHLPPLRDRREDIHGFVDYFLKRESEKNGSLKTFDALAMQKLLQHPFPGNVRELENLCHWAQVMVGGDVIHLEDIDPLLQSDFSEDADLAKPTKDNHSLDQGNHTATKLSSPWITPLMQSLEHDLQQQAVPLFPRYQHAFEHAILTTALMFAKGNKSKAADLIGINRNTLAKWTKNEIHQNAS